MNAVGIYEAKNQFSRLVALAEDGQETVITRHGRPVARVVPTAPATRVLGGQRGQFVIPDGWDEYTEEDDRLWYDGAVYPENENWGTELNEAIAQAEAARAVS